MDSLRTRYQKERIGSAAMVAFTAACFPETGLCDRSILGTSIVYLCPIVFPCSIVYVCRFSPDSAFVSLLDRDCSIYMFTS